MATLFEEENYFASDRCSFFVIIRVLDKYFKTKVDAKDIEDAEQIIEKTIIGFEYQIMNIYKANE